MNVVKALHKLKSLTQDYGKTQFLIHFNCNIGQLNGLYYNQDLSEHEYNYINIQNKVCIIFSKYDDVIEFFINNNIYHVLMFFPGISDTLFAFNYNIKQVATLKIMKYYKKYKYNIYKKRMDPLKRELMEYCYHPKRLIF
jgi:hypothetical protein